MCFLEDLSVSELSAAVHWKLCRKINKFLVRISKYMASATVWSKRGSHPSTEVGSWSCYHVAAVFNLVKLLKQNLKEKNKSIWFQEHPVTGSPNVPWWCEKLGRPECDCHPCSKNIITHFKAIGCLSSNKGRALMCTLMKTGWPFSNQDDRGRRGSKTKPPGASKHRAAINPGCKQNASYASNLRRPLSFLKAW